MFYVGLYTVFSFIILPDFFRDSHWTVLPCILTTHMASSIYEHSPFRATPLLNRGCKTDTNITVMSTVI